MQTIRSTRGFTLLEFVVVIALAAAVMAGVAALVTKGDNARAYNEIATEYQKVLTGFAEMSTARGGLVCTTWITLDTASVASYFPASVKQTAPIRWYMYAGTPHGIIQPVFYSGFTYDQVSTSMDKLKAAGICNASSYAALSGSTPYQVCYTVAYEDQYCR